MRRPSKEGMQIQGLDTRVSQFGLATSWTYQRIDSKLGCSKKKKERGNPSRASTSWNDRVALIRFPFQGFVRVETKCSSSGALLFSSAWNASLQTCHSSDSIRTWPSSVYTSVVRCSWGGAFSLSMKRVSCKWNALQLTSVYYDTSRLCARWACFMVSWRRFILDHSNCDAATDFTTNGAFRNIHKAM